MEINLYEIGKRLVEFRKSLKLSQLDFAKKAEISRSYITNVETGKVNPSFDFLVKISLNYNVSIDWLLFDKGNMYLLSDEHFLNNISDAQMHILNILSKHSDIRQVEIIDGLNSILGTNE